MKKKGKITKRWPKHGSSSSNPEGRRFRNAAKSGFFKPSGPSVLSIEAIQKHDNDDEGSDSKMQLDAENLDAKTFNTWATNFTNCTNVTFSRVLKLWSDSNRAFHKEVIATLAALTEIINERGGTGAHTEYFAILLTTLESRKTEESAAAAAYLLSLIVKRIPASILKSRFAEISKQILEIIVENAQSESTTLLKSLLSTLAFVLRAQDAAVWNFPSTVNTFKCLLDFTLHKKPRVRKEAHRGVQLVFKGSLFLTLPDSPAFHPATKLTAEFCVSTIESKGGKSGGADEMDTLHALSLLQDVMVTFPRKHIEESCTTILRVMTVNRPLVIANGMAALYGLFSQHPSAAALPAEVNAQIINALHDYHPEENDSGTMPGWLAVMEQAHLHLSSLDITLCLSHLPRLFTAAMACLLSHHKDIRTCATKLINLLLKQCIGLEWEKLAAQLKGQRQGGMETALLKVIQTLEAGLSYQYHHNWNLVFQLLATMMEVFGKICPELLKKCLCSLADLYESAHFGFKADIDVVVGKAIKSMGPRQVMDALPLNITGNEEKPDLSRSWLLPVLRDNVCDTELSFFAGYFLPLADRFRRKAQELATQQNVAIAKTYESLETQVWGLLKGFCTRPSDLAESFKGLAKKLGNVLTDRPALQLEIMASLRLLINFSKNSETHKAVMMRFAKNFVPILLNLFTTAPENVTDTRRLAVLETLKVYFSISNSELLTNWLDMCLTKSSEKDISIFRKIALIDIAMTMVKYADDDRIKKLFNLAEANLGALDKTLQKKSYRILEEICASESQACRQFLAANVSRLPEILVTSLSACAPGTRNPRLRCLASICHQLEEPNAAFVQAVIPEAIMCTRAVGERARAAATHLILEIAETMIRWNPDAEIQEVLSSFINLMYAGLAGSSEMITGTLLAVSSVVVRYRDLLSESSRDTLVDMLTLLLPRQQSEIRKAALALVKIIVGAFQLDLTTMEKIVQGIASMDTKARLRMQTKQIFKKLIKKFGYEVVHKHAPESVRKVIQKAHKEMKQAEKRKENKPEAEESDSEAEAGTRKKPETIEEILEDSDEEDEQEKGAAPSETKSKQRKVWIREEEEEIVDLLDVSAAKKVIASKPRDMETEDTSVEVKAKDPGFKIAPDGRFIITEPKEDKGEKVDSDEEDLDDLLTALEGGSEKKRRKRLRDARDNDEPPMKYQAGGSGIHRPLKQAKKDDGKDYKAKKAGGDIKKAGKHDPYAYVPLNFANLNKRKQAKLKGQFASFVKGAKKGVLKAKRRTSKKK